MEFQHDKSFFDGPQHNQHMEEPKASDMNAYRHGNWNLENAKNKLHQYMQMNEITADYEFSSTGPDHARCDSLRKSVGFLVEV